MVTAESDDLPCPRVRPLRRDYPPGAEAACFHLHPGDCGLNLSTARAASPGENDQNDHYQHCKTKDYIDHHWNIHVLFPPELVHQPDADTSIQEVGQECYEKRIRVPGKVLKFHKK